MPHMRPSSRHRFTYLAGGKEPAVRYSPPGPEKRRPCIECGRDQIERGEPPEIRQVFEASAEYRTEKVRPEGATDVCCVAEGYRKYERGPQNGQPDRDDRCHDAQPPREPD